MLIVSSDSLTNYGLHRVFRFVKEAGFDGIEIAMTRDYDSQDGEYLLELSKEYDLPVISVTGPSKSSKKGILRTIDIAKTVGAQIVVVQPPELLNFKLTNWMKNEIPKIRKKEKIHVCLENTDASTFLGILPKYAMNSLNDLKSFKSVCLDTANLASKKIDLMRIYGQLKENIKHIHLSNAKGSKSHIYLTKGILPLESFLTALKENNYEGAISIKVKPSELKVAHQDKLMKSLKEAKAFCEKYL